MFYTIVQQYARSLKNLDAILRKAVSFAEARRFDPNNFCTMKLAPDMFTLTRQVQSACDAAKFSAALLSGKEAPKHEDTEKTMDELLGRVGKVRTYLDSFKEEDFAKTQATTRVRIPFPQGKGMLALDSAVQRAMPNFYFHVTAAYIILRHSGVELGKSDYLGGYTTFDM